MPRRYNDPSRGEGRLDGACLYDDEGNLSIDFNARNLYSPNGTSVVASWGTSQLWTSAATLAMDWHLPFELQLFGGDVQVVGQLWNSTGTVKISAGP